MALREELSRQGNWLFRWRSFLPLVITPFLPLAYIEFASNPPSYGYSLLDWYTLCCLGISASGFIVRAVAIGFSRPGTSGGNTKKQKAAMINTSGLYSLVRHPLYLGNGIIFTGVMLFIQVWWFVIIALLLFWIYYERIMYREEDFLIGKFGEAYLDWSIKTPAFFPRTIRWQSPQRAFSWRRLLKREYIGYFELISCFTILAYAKLFLRENSLSTDLIWATFWGLGVLFFIILRVVKKTVWSQKKSQTA